jgi:geranylgeranyl pyrophosphate synthase
MWRKQRYQALHDEIEASLTDSIGVAGLTEIIQETFDQYWRKSTSKTHQNHPWPLLPLIVCEAISGQYELALPAASTLYLLRISAEIFDDIEDADSPESLPVRYGTAIAANAATAFLISAEREITRLAARNVKARLTVRVMDIINSAYISACGGQHMDLSPDLKMALSENDYLHMIEMKSASIIKCACHVGALLAAANTMLLNKFKNFGYNLGMASQIANDILGVSGGKDILFPKITLPVIFVLNQADSKIRKQLGKIYIEKDRSGYDPSHVKELFFSSGAIQYATIKMEYYKQLAGETLSEIEKQLVDTTRLKIFLA